MADGLLNKASIILTPTGYKAGTLYNVAPVVEPYEDFDFARASVASRVNSSGLVEMVGRTLSSELVTNGDFATDSDWTKGTGWSIGDGKATHTGSTTGNLIQDIGIGGKVVFLTFDILSIEDGVCNVYDINNATTYASFSTTGLKTLYFQSVSNSIGFRSNSTNVSIDNVSVKEVIDTNNIPRINYDSNGDNGHILLEPTSTNLVTYSEDFSEWSNSGGTLTPNAAVSPSGENNAYKYNTDGAYRIFRNLVTLNTSTNYTFTFYAKNIDAANAYYRVYNNTNASDVISVTNYISQINTSTWTRIEVNFTTDASGTEYAVYLMSGDSGGDILFWGAQLEALSYSTSYIPTLTGSTVTRATETANGAGSADLINSTEGVLYAEIENTTGTEAIYKMINITDSSKDNRIGLFVYQNRISAESTGSGTNLGIYSKALQSGFNKIAVKYKENDCALWINGIEYTDTSFAAFSSNTLNSLVFERGDGANPFYGKCKALAVFNEALSDSELTQLTT